MSTKHLIILVHGIRTRAYWMSNISPVLKAAGFVVAPTSYGRFNLLRFLIPGSIFKREAVDRTRREITAAIAQHNPHQVSIIAHSFGTYVVSQIMADNPQTRWHRLIFCGSVLPENFPFSQYAERFNGPLLNEIGTKDFLPALAESITWGYGSIGTHGINSPNVENRWNANLSHSDFLTPTFVQNFWVPFLLAGNISIGANANPSWLSKIISALFLRWTLPLAFLLLIFAWPYLWISPVRLEANIEGCDLYRSSNAATWRKTNLRDDQIGSYYVILKSISRFKDYPIINEAYARLEAHRLRSRFSNIDVDAMPTAGTNSNNKMWAVVLARGLPEKRDACEIRNLARACGMAEDESPYVYRLRGGPEGC